MNLLDQAIYLLSPEWALRRAHARQLFARYESAKPSRGRRELGNGGGDADRDLQWSRKPLRDKARWFDANSGYATGAFDTFVASLVGTQITTEPFVLRRDSTPHTRFNEQLKALWNEWCERPHIAGRYTMGSADRLCARTLARDGGFMVRMFEGLQYRHFTRFPLSLEYLEPDQLADLTDPARRIVMGVEKDEFGVHLFYHLLRKHPGGIMPGSNADTIRVPAADLFYVIHAKRLNQGVGVTKLHAVENDMQDIHELDRYEMEAAKQGAAIGLVFERTADWEQALDAAGNPVDRPAIEKFWPGMVVDGLDVGEVAKMLNPNSRPNPNLKPFRTDRLREVSTGSGLCSPSAMMGEYGGSYSAERQGLVDNQRRIDPQIADFFDYYKQPLYARWVQAVVQAGLVKVPWGSINQRTLTRARHKAPKMPWIDPGREVTAMEKMVQAGFDSRTSQIRATGRNPEEVRQEFIMENEQDRKAGLSFTTSPDGIPENVSGNGVTNA